MELQTLQDLRNHLETFVSNRLAYFDRRLSTVEEIQKGSVNSKEGRIRTEVQIEAELKSLNSRINALERADNKLSERFAQVWIALLIAGFIAIATFLFELYRSTK